MNGAGFILFLVALAALFAYQGAFPAGRCDGAVVSAFLRM